MIRWTRSARIAPEKFPQAIQFAKEIADYSNKKYKTQTSVYMDSVGEYGTIRWFCDFADFAAWEKVGSQLMADQEYLQKVNKAADLFIHGSVFDTVMRAI
ncbi:MAG TPA: NIPSNAP family protein [Thermodesulfobacteriota bacterium]|nr:NIPSNAP family protein [Thermodesulfobacteriota bacterium]